MRLARVGHENVVGYLENGILSWDQAGLPLARTEQITVDELDRRIKEHAVDAVVDVRRPGEWQSCHIAQAMHHPLSQLAQTAGQLPKDKSVAVICASGYRSFSAASLLEQLGFKRITNVVGGMNAWQNAHLDVIT